MAIEMASLNAVASPQDGEVFSSTHQFAVTSLMDDGAPSDNQPVYAAVFHGNFVGYGASTPSGNFPVGNTMIVLFDANSLEVTDWALVPSTHTPVTANLGPATSLGF